MKIGEAVREKARSLKQARATRATCFALRHEFGIGHSLTRTRIAKLPGPCWTLRKPRSKLFPPK